MYLPNPDPVLKARGQDIEIYTELLSEPRTGGCVDSRKGGVKALKWGISREKASARHHRFIENIFKKLKIKKITEEILSAPLFGYQPLEINWQNNEGLYFPADVVGKPQEWFVFSRENELRFRSRSNMINGEELPRWKFLCPTHQASYKNPYGIAALSKCFWPVTFKKGGFRFWVVFTEKYGMPFVIGKHPRGASDGEIQRLLDMLDDMVQDAIAAIPDDSSVEYKESPFKASSASIYKLLIDACNAEIAISILGQTLTTEVGSTGSYAAGKVHAGVRQDILNSDKEMVAEI